MLFYFLFLGFSCIRGEVRVCGDFYPPRSAAPKVNCTLVCGLRFHVPPANETAICDKGSSVPISCTTPRDCGRSSIGAYCKLVPCLCETDTAQPYYLFHHEFPSLSICVVSTKWTHPDMPLVPFPWLTLIIVFGILLLLGLCLVMLRWISPYLRKMQSKREARNPGMNAYNSQENAEASALFSSVLQPGCSRNLRSQSASRAPLSTQQSSRRLHARYLRWNTPENSDPSTSCAIAEDEPPPYEIAIQMQTPSCGEGEAESAGHDLPDPTENENTSLRTETSDHHSTEQPLS